RRSCAGGVDRGVRRAGRARRRSAPRAARALGPARDDRRARRRRLHRSGCGRRVLFVEPSPLRARAAHAWPAPGRPEGSAEGVDRLLRRLDRVPPARLRAGLRERGAPRTRREHQDEPALRAASRRATILQDWRPLDPAPLPRAVRARRPAALEARARPAPPLPGLPARSLPPLKLLIVPLYAPPPGGGGVHGPPKPRPPLPVV